MGKLTTKDLIERTIKGEAFQKAYGDLLCYGTGAVCVEIVDGKPAIRHVTIEEINKVRSGKS